MAKKISVINFKGGVGKTTLSFHLAAHLSQENRVLAVDLDHQSSLSVVIMGGKLWKSAVDNKLTSNSIFESFCNRKVAMPGDEIIHRNPMHQRRRLVDHYPNLDLVPAQFQLDDTEIEMASTTIGSPAISEWQKRTLVAEWLDDINAEDNYDYIIFDCPPATKLVSQNAIAASDFYIVPTIPDSMSTRGVTHFVNLVKTKIDGKMEYLRTSSGISSSAVPKSYVASTEMAGIVPFLAKTAGNAKSGLTAIHTQQLSSLRRTWGPVIIDTVVTNLTGVPEALLQGQTVWKAYGTPNILRARTDLLAACQELEARLI